MDDDHLRPPEGPPGQTLSHGPSLPAIELSDLSSSSQEVVSSANSLSASNTPPSTPATSLRPSFNSDEDPSNSRPLSSNGSPNLLAENQTREDNETQSPDAVPNEEPSPSPSSAEGRSNASNDPLVALETAVQKLFGWWSTYCLKVLKWASFQTFIGLSISVLAVPAFVFSYRSYQLAKWESWHDFREYCTAPDNRQKNKACQAFVSQPLVEPPYRTGSGITRRTAQALKPVIALSRHVQYDKCFYALLGLLTMLLLLHTLHRSRRLAHQTQPHPQAPTQPEDPPRPQAPWDLIPLRWLQRIRYTSAAPVDWTSAPVRSGVPISTYTQTDDGQDRGRRQYIPTRPETTSGYQSTTLGSVSRRKAFQEHLNDFWTSPPWRENGALPIQRDGETPRRGGSNNDSYAASLSGVSSSGASQHTPSSSLRSRFRGLIPRLDSSSSESEPFTALRTDQPHRGSTPPESCSQGTRLHIDSDAVSLGMVLSGATVAAIAGGEAGQDILAREGTQKCINTPLPQAPQDLSVSP